MWGKNRRNDVVEGRKRSVSVHHLPLYELAVELARCTIFSMLETATTHSQTRVVLTRPNGAESCGHESKKGNAENEKNGFYDPPYLSV